MNVRKVIYDRILSAAESQAAQAQRDVLTTRAEIKRLVKQQQYQKAVLSEAHRVVSELRKATKKP